MQVLMDRGATLIPEDAEEKDGEENILHTLTKYAGNRKFLNFMTGWLGRGTSLWSKIEKKHRQNSHPIIRCPTSEGESEVSERARE